MIISKVAQVELYTALKIINKLYFHGNARFYDGTPEVMNKACTVFRVRLAVHDIDGHGAIRTTSKGWRSHYACWHLHGYFFSALPKEAKVLSHSRRFNAHDAWEDWNAGSQMFPVMQSYRCLCESVDGKLQFIPTFEQMDVSNYSFVSAYTKMGESAKEASESLGMFELSVEEMEGKLENLEAQKKVLEEGIKKEETVEDVYMRLMDKRLNNLK